MDVTFCEPNIKETIIIEIVAEDEQIIKDMFKVLSDQLFQNYQLIGYKIMYKEKEYLEKLKDNNA